MTIDAALVQRVASLSGLEWSEAESVEAQTYLRRVLGYVAELSALPPVDLAQSQDGGCLSALERADVLLPSLEPEAVIANASVTEGSAFQVPRIIE